MGKVVVKTAFKTLLILVCLALLAFAIASFGFPQHMATLTENMGWYSAAVNYSSLRYSYTADVDDLARCAEDAIMLGDDEVVIEYCSQLVGHTDYAGVCGEKDSYYASGSYSEYTLSYNQYICGKYSTALARTGERDQAVEVASTANGSGSFARGNALASLALWAAENSDAQTASLVVAAMDNITISQSDSDYDYYNSIYKIVSNAAV